MIGLCVHLQVIVRLVKQVLKSYEAVALEQAMQVLCALQALV